MNIPDMPRAPSRPSGGSVNENFRASQIERTHRIINAVRALYPEDFASAEVAEAMWMAMQQLSGGSLATEIIRQSSTTVDCK